MFIGVTYRMPDSSVALTRDNNAEGMYATGLTIPIMYEIKFEMYLAHPYTGQNPLLGFRESGAYEGECGWNVPGIYLAPPTDDLSYNDDFFDFVIVTCRSGNGNRWRNNLLSAANFGKWAC